MSAALGIARDRLILDPPNLAVPAGFLDMVERRAKGEPIAYITGHRDFWTIDLEVGPAPWSRVPTARPCSSPRSSISPASPGPQAVLDLGTGPGTLLLAALDEWPNATGLGIDASPAALAYAQRNADRLGLPAAPSSASAIGPRGSTSASTSSCATRPTSRSAPTPGPGSPNMSRPKRFTPGPKASTTIAASQPQIGCLLAPGGLAAIEIGYDQAEPAAALFEAQMHLPIVAFDLGDRPRALLIRG